MRKDDGSERVHLTTYFEASAESIRFLDRGRQLLTTLLLAAAVAVGAGLLYLFT